MADLSPESLRLTLDELEDIEDIIGVPAAQWESASQAKMLKAMLFVVKRRDNPKLKLSDVGKIRVDEIDAEITPLGLGASEAS